MAYISSVVMSRVAFLELHPFNVLKGWFIPLLIGVGAAAFLALSLVRMAFAHQDGYVELDQAISKAADFNLRHPGAVLDPSTWKLALWVRGSIRVEGILYIVVCLLGAVASVRSQGASGDLAVPLALIAAAFGE